MQEILTVKKIALEIHPGFCVYNTATLLKLRNAVGDMIGANLGMLPLVIVYTFFGCTLKSVGEKPWVVAIPVVVIIVFVLVASFITKKLIEKTKAKRKEN